MQQYQEKIICEECNIPGGNDHRYCHNCGSYLSAEAVTINVFNNSNLRKIFSFYFVYLFVCLLVKHSGWFKSYDQLFWIEITLATITIYFASYKWRSLQKMLVFRNFSWKLLVALIVLAVTASLIVSFCIREFTYSFFKTDISYFKAYKIYSHPVAVMIYSIAIMPAIFEELAFRGVMYNYCKAFLDERLVVIVTAFLFGVMHLSLISIVWLIPFGIFMGNLRRKYDTLWYGIIFHFAFNLTACLFDLQKQGQLF